MPWKTCSRSRRGTVVTVRVERRRHKVGEEIEYRRFARYDAIRPSSPASRCFPQAPGPRSRAGDHIGALLARASKREEVDRVMCDCKPVGEAPHQVQARGLHPDQDEGGVTRRFFHQLPAAVSLRTNRVYRRRASSARGHRDGDRRQHRDGSASDRADRDGKSALEIARVADRRSGVVASIIRVTNDPSYSTGLVPASPDFRLAWMPDKPA